MQSLLHYTIQHTYCQQANRLQFHHQATGETWLVTSSSQPRKDAHPLHYTFSLLPQFPHDKGESTANQQIPQRQTPSIRYYIHNAS